MCPGAVVIVQIREKYVAHVPLAEDDDMIKTFPSDRATRHRSDDEGFGCSAHKGPRLCSTVSVVTEKRPAVSDLKLETCLIVRRRHSEDRGRDRDLLLLLATMDMQEQF
jgi:hypothetical protein